MHRFFRDHWDATVPGDFIVPGVMRISVHAVGGLLPAEPSCLVWTVTITN
jgi:hypothetical protein